MAAKKDSSKSNQKKRSTVGGNLIGDPWHYPRPDLAEHFLNRFKIAGADSGIHFFAPRRRGKTQFLLLDLAPAAVKRKYTVVYASMWDDMNRPQQALMSSLERALDAKKKRRGILKGGLSRALKGLKAKAAFQGIEVSGELEFANNPASPTSEELNRIDLMVEELAGDDRRHSLLLMIDEVQHLASKEEFSALAGKLKSLATKFRSMDVVMTGSSRTGLSELFGSDKPLHNVTHSEYFPDLDDGFVEHLAKSYAFVTNGRSLEIGKLLELFESVDRSPFYLRGVIEAMILQPSLTINDAHKRILDAVSITGRYEERWNDLRAIDKLVLDRAIKGEQLYTPESLLLFTNAIFGKMKGKQVTRGLVQSSVKRLIELHYITPREGIRGRYDIEMLGFRDWVKQKIVDDAETGK